MRVYLSEEIIHTSFTRMATQAYLPHEFVEDPYRHLGHRYLPQISSHAEGLVCGSMPVFDLNHLRSDIHQFIYPRSIGIFDHRPFCAAPFGNPEKFFDIAEPYHEAVLRWGWNPHDGTGNEVLTEWAKMRFPKCWEDIVEVYRHLARIKEIMVRGEALIRWFPLGYTYPFDWRLLVPDAGVEGKFYGDWYSHLRENSEAPYGYPPVGKIFYLWEEKLRSISVTKKNINCWVKRFDATSFTKNALLSIEDALVKDPSNRHLKLLKLTILGMHMGARFFLTWAKAGLMSKLHNKKEEERLIKQAFALSYAQLIVPTSASMVWTRWGQRWYREDCVRTIRRVLDEGIGCGQKQQLDSLGGAFKPIKTSISDINKCDRFPLENQLLRDWKRLELSIGWQPWRQASSSKKHIFISFGIEAKMRREMTFTDIPENFYTDPHVTLPNIKHSFVNVPVGMQTFFEIPFYLPEEGKKLLLIGNSNLEGAIKSASIQVNGRFKTLYILGAAIGREEPGNTIANVKVCMHDGETISFPVRYRYEVTNYRFPEVTPESRVAWIEHYAEQGIYHQDRVIGFNFFSWLNPSDKVIEKFEFNASSRHASLLLFAMTGV